MTVLLLCHNVDVTCAAIIYRQQLHSCKWELLLLVDSSCPAVHASIGDTIANKNS